MARNGETDATTGKPTDVQAAGYAARKTTETKAAAQKFVAGIQLTKDVLVELISVAKVNPIIGAVLALIIVDTLAQREVLSKTGATLGYLMVGGAFGVSLADEVANDVTQILSSLSPFKQGGASAPNPAALIAPTATTYVEAPGTPPPSPWPLDDTVASVARYRARAASMGWND